MWFLIPYIQYKGRLSHTGYVFLTGCNTNPPVAVTSTVQRLLFRQLFENNTLLHFTRLCDCKGHQEVSIFALQTQNTHTS